MHGLGTGAPRAHLLPREALAFSVVTSVTESERRRQRQNRPPADNQPYLGTDWSTSQAHARKTLKPIKNNHIIYIHMQAHTHTHTHTHTYTHLHTHTYTHTHTLLYNRLIVLKLLFFYRA